MRRLIDVKDAQALPPSLTVKEGDLLVMNATGGRVQAGTEAIEIIGPFIPGVIGDNGEIFSPMGPPNKVLFLARRPGRATIDVITGDPWRSPKTTTVELIVEL
jgi:hypothetical protein